MASRRDVSFFFWLSLFMVLCFIKTTAAVKKTERDSRFVSRHVVESPKRFPYQASLRYYNSHVCGGSIIDNRHILTACHCVMDGGRSIDDVDLYTVAVGGLQRNDPKALVYYVQYIIGHHNYNEKSIENDVAIVRIYSEFYFDHLIQPISLVKERITEQTECIITGWGTTCNKEDISNALMYSEIQIIPTKQCNKTRRNIFPGMICAVTMEKSSCNGDSGGPLVCKGLLTGILSFDHDYGIRDNLGVYTDILVYRDWIQREIGTSSAPVPKYSLILILLAILLIGLLCFL